MPVQARESQTCILRLGSEAPHSPAMSQEKIGTNDSTDKEIPVASKCFNEEVCSSNVGKTSEETQDAVKEDGSPETSGNPGHGQEQRESCDDAILAAELEKLKLEVDLVYRDMAAGANPSSVPKVVASSCNKAPANHQVKKTSTTLSEPSKSKPTETSTTTSGCTRTKKKVICKRGVAIDESVDENTDDWKQFQAMQRRTRKECSPTPELEERNCSLEPGSDIDAAAPPVKIKFTLKKPGVRKSITGKLCGPSLGPSPSRESKSMSPAPFESPDRGSVSSSPAPETDDSNRGLVDTLALYGWTKTTYPRVVLVVDTSSLLSPNAEVALSSIVAEWKTARRWGRIAVFVPQVVVRELDGLKNRADISADARRASRALLSCMADCTVLEKMRLGRAVQMQTLSMEAAAKAIQKRDEKLINDDTILRSAMHVHSEIGSVIDVVIVTGDKNLQLKCLGENMDVCSSLDGFYYAMVNKRNARQKIMHNQGSFGHVHMGSRPSL